MTGRQETGRHGDRIQEEQETERQAGRGEKGHRETGDLKLGGLVKGDRDTRRWETGRQ